MEGAKARQQEQRERAVSPAFDALALRLATRLQREWGLPWTGRKRRSIPLELMQEVERALGIQWSTQVARTSLQTVVTRIVDHGRSTEPVATGVARAVGQAVQRLVGSRWDKQLRTRLGCALFTEIDKALPRLLAVADGEQRAKFRRDANGVIHWFSLKPTTCLTLHPQAVQRYGDALVVAIQRRPLVVPPIPWSRSTRGGYHHALREHFSLLTNGHNPACPDAVYDALNTLQNVAWRINEAVLAVAQQEPEESLRRRATRWERTTWVSRRNTRRMILAQAAPDAHEAELYFVCRLDFRGRVYYLGTPYSPQGPDLARALLCFAKGESIPPVTETITKDAYGRRVVPDNVLAIKALDQYGAECRGVKEVDLAEVNAIGTAPANTRHLWQQAKEKKRYQYLAYCIERTALAKAHAAGRPFVTTLPVWLDAHANAFQHVALLTRNDKLAPSVGFTVNGKHSLYEDVQQAASDKLGQPVEREDAKFVLMRAGYGAGRKKVRQEWMREHPGSTVVHATAFVNAVWFVLQGNRDLRFLPTRQWFQRVGEQLAKQGQHAVWKVPGTSFRVYRRYVERRRQDKLPRFRFTIAGRLHQPSAPSRDPDASSPLDQRKHASALMPNVVHSLDAATLMLTVRFVAASWTGLPIATVHDAFGVLCVHAPNVQRAFQQALRTVYEGRPLIRRLARQWGITLSKGLLGSLDPGKAVFEPKVGLLG